MPTIPIKWLKDKLNNAFFPVTHVSAVRNDVGVPLDSLLQQKQDALVSGTNIKTINGQSVLGQGDLTVATAEVVYTDYVESYRGQGSATFIGKNSSSASTLAQTWKLRVVWHTSSIQIYDYINVSWDDRYDYPIINN